MIEDELLGQPYTKRTLLCVCGGWLYIYEQTVHPPWSEWAAEQMSYSAETRMWFAHDGALGEFCIFYRDGVKRLLEQDLRDMHTRVMRAFQESISHGIHGL